MKKAKIMLTAIGLLAVVGGALAFKAVRTPVNFYRENAQGQCNELVRIAATTQAGTPNTFLSTAPTTDPCPNIRTVQVIE